MSKSASLGSDIKRLNVGGTSEPQVKPPHRSCISAPQTTGMDSRHSSLIKAIRCLEVDNRNPLRKKIISCHDSSYFSNLKILFHCISQNEDTGQQVSRDKTSQIPLKWINVTSKQQSRLSSDQAYIIREIRKRAHTFWQTSRSHKE